MKRYVMGHGAVYHSFKNGLIYWYKGSRTRTIAVDRKFQLKLSPDDLIGYLCIGETWFIENSMLPIIGSHYPATVRYNRLNTIMQGAILV